jgi:hypothetical protein
MPRWVYTTAIVATVALGVLMLAVGAAAAAMIGVVGRRRGGPVGPEHERVLFAEGAGSLRARP